MGKPTQRYSLSARFWLAVLVGIAFTVPVSFATYLAPQLIVLHDQPALTAMKMSLVGCFKNILPGIVFFLCSTLLVVVSMIPLFLGLLIIDTDHGHYELHGVPGHLRRGKRIACAEVTRCD